ncbi:hypothetical protein HanPI659440_Chr14g0570221 [Helianthus annuus]|nr:hypothetical protein HanPI659440_Chr14g0570221 [Helianthus annuus]
MLYIIKCTLLSKYKMVKDHITKLRELGASVHHKVDDTKMSQNSIFSDRKFNVIIYNFPHAGFSKGIDSEKNVIRLHKRLVKDFFENAIKMLSGEGEVHVTHKDKKYTKCGILKVWLFQQRLVKGFFENAIKMLSVEGEVHVTHKDEGIYKTWNIEGLAFSGGLHLHEQENFRISEYHSYENKYDDGQHPDDAFT